MGGCARQTEDVRMCWVVAVAWNVIPNDRRCHLYATYSLKNMQQAGKILKMLGGPTDGQGTEETADGSRRLIRTDLILISPSSAPSSKCPSKLSSSAHKPKAKNPILACTIFEFRSCEHALLLLIFKRALVALFGAWLLACLVGA